MGGNPQWGVLLEAMGAMGLSERVESVQRVCMLSSTRAAHVFFFSWFATPRLSNNLSGAQLSPIFLLWN
jgi:hypothetical protein